VEVDGVVETSDEDEGSRAAFEIMGMRLRDLGFDDGEGGCAVITPEGSEAEAEAEEDAGSISSGDSWESVEWVPASYWFGEEDTEEEKEVEMGVSGDAAHESHAEEGDTGFASSPPYTQIADGTGTGTGSGSATSSLPSAHTSGGSERPYSLPVPGFTWIGRWEGGGDGNEWFCEAF
jgi:hypothetical protein